MTSFIGDILCKIEENGRVLFPSTFKKQLKNGENTFIVKKDIYEKCLVMYTIEEWEKQLNNLRQSLNPYNREHNQLLREFFKNTAEVTLDSNGRITLPRRLLDQIEVNKEIYLLGLDTKIEIWAKEVYEKSQISQDLFIELANKILG